MKKILLFHFASCPYCKSARQWLDELRAENPAYQAIEIEMIDEIRHPLIARKYDYWLVPTFYVDGEKVHEGVCSKNKVQQVLEYCLTND